MRFLVSVFTLFLGSLNALGQDSLPIGNIGKLIDDAVRHVEYFHIEIGLVGPDKEGKISWSSPIKQVLEAEYVKYDSTKGDCAEFIASNVKRLMRLTLENHPSSPTEGTLVAWFRGEKDLKGPQESILHLLIGMNVFTPIKTANGWSVPEKQYTVDMRAAATRTSVRPIFIPGLARAKLTLYLGSAESTFSYDSADPSDWGLHVNLTHGIVYLPTEYLEGFQGKVEVWYTDASKKVFNNADGSLIAVTPSPYRKLRIVAITPSSVELEVETTEGDAGKPLILEVSTDLKTWVPLQSGLITTGTNKRLVPRAAASSFFRAYRSP